MTRSARDEYTPGYAANAVAFMANRTARTHAAFFLPQLRAGWRLLDCGCGPGSITAGLAEAVAPGEAIGLDREPGQLETARAGAVEAGLSNLVYQAGDVYDMPFDAGEFDAVFSHALLEHLRRPERALREMRRVLRRGGIVGVCSPDWGGFLIAPPDAAVERALAFYERIQRENGGDPRVGRRIGSLLAEAGFSDVRVDARYECYARVDSIAEYLALRVEASPAVDDAVGRGWTDGAQIEAMAAALRDWCRDSAAMFAQAWVMGVGRASANS